MVIVGLPASGKTHLCKHEFGGCQIFDDVIDGHKKAQDNLLPSLKRMAQTTGKVICNDIFLCRRRTAEEFRWLLTELFRGVPQEWIYFANDPGQCRINAKSDRTDQSRRSDRLDLISVLTKEYYIPSGVPARPVYRFDARCGTLAALNLNQEEAGPYPIAHPRSNAQ